MDLVIRSQSSPLRLENDSSGKQEGYGAFNTDALILLTAEPPLGDPFDSILGLGMLDEITQDRPRGFPVLDRIRRFAHIAPLNFRIDVGGCER